jgi:hypothetical protein
MLVILPSPHPGAPTRPYTPKVLRVRECASIFYSSVVFISDSHLNLSRSLGSHHSHSPTLLGTWNVIPKFHYWPALSQALTLVAGPRLGLRHLFILQCESFMCLKLWDIRWIMFNKLKIHWMNGMRILIYAFFKIPKTIIISKSPHKHFKVVF